ncbi:serine/threonine-protein kinase [Arthrobacter sp. OV608]|uniref:serine/threonine-protein kinase n=1 Tax=Arthrobacter sp. OV608 TaxID=1882768 RepID=UPI0008BD04FD|nr:serine/threonine protein kinase [Arthrobacter sp. OV608]
MPLGSGGQGVVYEVFDHHLKQKSALKILTEVAPHEVWKEAELLTRLSGKFLLPVRNADLVNGLPYVVTEIARHGTTDNLLTPGIGVSPSVAVRWVIHACRGIARMHDFGLVHNDIKPGNLFLDSHGDALVGDLGFASQLRPSGGAPLSGGTPATMPPEVAAAMLAGDAQGEPCSVASDIYGLGATLYWLIAGHPPFVGSTAANVLAQVVAGPPSRLHTIAPHAPRGITLAVEKAMSPVAAERFLSAADLDYALARVTQSARVWTRIAAHSGHADCFEGIKGRSVLAVCARPTGVRTKHEIIVRHKKSGRLAGRPVEASLPTLSQRLRTTIRSFS